MTHETPNYSFEKVRRPYVHRSAFACRQSKGLTCGVKSPPSTPVLQCTPLEPLIWRTQPQQYCNTCHVTLVPHFVFVWLGVTYQFHAANTYVIATLCWRKGPIYATFGFPSSYFCFFDLWIRDPHPVHR